MEHSEILKESAELLFEGKNFMLVIETDEGQKRCFTHGSDAEIAELLRDILASNPDIEDILNDAKALLRKDRINKLKSNTGTWEL